MSNSCIEIIVGRVGNPLAIEVARNGDGLDFLASRRGKPLAHLVERIGEALNLTSSRVGEPLSFRCGLVCSVGSEFYLRVPLDSIWLIPNNDFSQDVVVYSNVDWVIE